uniref:Kinesin motor domain-containing protein n=1 Tax=Graphocephala atropunctata TaxID=36148 RepID=A0A1B6LSL1_9HEMI
MASNPPALNIHSYIRVRPLKKKEKRSSHLEFKRKEVVIKSENSRNERTLAFDRVFDEDTQQELVYNTVVRPMVKEVLQGYNCTVFAYGQTGTGKTHTITGEQGIPGVENEDAGIIPRVMEDIFKELDSLAHVYQVSIIYIELYNEKLRNLLNEHNSFEEFNIQMLDDGDRGVILKGLMPTPVKSMNEAFRLLQRGTLKRQSAATFMNVNSSRSHTIFTINVNIKEMAIDDREDVMRIGKLHLVDLAGSENVTKSGANDQANRNALGVNRRLTEASNINRSLLTLGRVITCITENNPHIPYRESKLTRLLRDSLGGKTKTCVIGTISPSQSNLDETESTLNYAYKARSIKNKPEKNKNISDKEFMQVVEDEITKLRRELETLRQGEGFHISTETYEQMNSRIKELKEQVETGDDRYNRLYTSSEAKREVLNQLNGDLCGKNLEFEELQKTFHSEKEKFNQKIKEMSKELLLREHFVKEYEKTQEILKKQTKACDSVVEILLQNGAKLHDKIQRKVTVEGCNAQELVKFKTTINTNIDQLSNDLQSFNKLEEKFHSDATNKMKSFLEDLLEKIDVLTKGFEEFEEKTKEFVDDAKSEREQFASEVKGASQNIGVFKREYGDKIDKLEEKIDEQEKSILDRVMNQCQEFTSIAESVDQFNEEIQGNIQEIIMEIERNTRRLDDASKNIMESVDGIEEYYKRIMAEVNQAEMKAKLAAEKARQVLESIEELNILTEETQQATEAIESTVSSCSENINDVKKNFSNEFEECKAQTSSTIQKMLKCQDKTKAFDKELPDKVQGLFDGVATVVDDFIPCVDSELVAFSNAISEFKSSVEEKIQIMMNTFENHSVNRENASKMFKTYQEGFFDTVKKTQLEIEKYSDTMLREMHYKYLDRVEVLKTEEFKTATAVNNITEEVTSFGYTPDVSLGVTPQRVSLTHLDFPRQLASTATREVLTRRFLQSQGLDEDHLISHDTQGAVSQQITKRDEENECEQSTELLQTVIEVGGTIHHSSSVSDITEIGEECTLKISKTKRIITKRPRRSISVPDLTTACTGLVPYLSPEQDKENMAISKCEKKPNLKKSKAILPNTKPKNHTKQSFRALKESNLNSAV